MAERFGVGASTVARLERQYQAVKKALDAITLADIQGFFRGSGYAVQYL